MPRVPAYCQVKDVADWLRITVNPNTDPTTSMIEEYIMQNEDHFDRETGHTFAVKTAVEEFSTTKLYDWGRGMPLFPRHRNIKDFSAAAGDKFELWDGSQWIEQTVAPGNDGIIYFQNIKGITYIRGYLFTILRTNRFRVTYRYGGNNDTEKTDFDDVQLIPRDVKKCLILMTCLDLLGSDFKMSQVAYGGEGNVDKQKVMDRWQKQIDKIIWNHSEIISVW